MFELKPISRDGVQAALQKAERYRLLNEPWEAESICLDILELEPANQAALVSLLLAITDQFRTGEAHRAGDAKGLIAKLEGGYQQAYYTGIIWERGGTALHRLASPGWGPVAYERLRRAMEWYEKAIELRPSGDDSAIVRWNSCARFIMSHEEVKEAPPGRSHTLLE
jgi:tetratricopeptide (TPR) repeat protein